MRSLLRHVLSSLLIVAASNASAGVISQDGVVFTSTYVGNVLTLEIDAANRSGGWAGASAIDALSLKTIGGFSGVNMRSSAGASWALSQSELNAGGCAAPKGKASASQLTRLCYTGAGIALADNMLFTFSFTGAPALSAPHLKVHFVDAKGNKVGSLLSLDFPWQAASTPAGGTSPAPALIPAPVVVPPVNQQPAPDATLPVSAPDKDASAVPEPRTLGLITAGLLMLALARRRRP
jgi:hypothetical protein